MFLYSGSVVGSAGYFCRIYEKTLEGRLIKKKNGFRIITITRCFGMISAKDKAKASHFSSSGGASSGVPSPAAGD